MKLIGEGEFTRAYLRPDGKVLLKSICPIKECMSYGWFPESRLFPKLEHIDCDDHSKFYLTEYYPKVSSLKDSLNEKHWAMYKELQKLPKGFGVYKYDKLDFWRETFPTLKNKRLRDTMMEALDACSNYGTSICFEISPRNVATKNGKLILLDCFFQAGAKSLDHNFYRRQERMEEKSKYRLTI